MRNDGIHAAAVYTAHAPPVAVYIHVQLRQAPWPETLAVGTGSTGGPPHVSWGDMAQCTRLDWEGGCVDCCLRHVKGSDKGPRVKPQAHLGSIDAKFFSRLASSNVVTTDKS
jgi:hypothetical protein